MAYFPFFQELTGKHCLVIGGGPVALRKIKKLIPFGPEITVVAPEFCKGLRELENIRLVSARYEPGMEDDAFMVIAATDDRALNSRICRSCCEKRIAVNSATGKDSGSFLFPALVKKGLLTVGIVSGGAGPDAAVGLKERIEEIIPSHIEEILDWMQTLRPKLIAQIPDASTRGKLLRALFDRAAELDRPLTDAETEERLNEYNR